MHVSFSVLQRFDFFFQICLLELQGKLEMAEKIADELKKQLSIEKTELSRHRELMAESTRALTSKQENIGKSQF